MIEPNVLAFQNAPLLQAIDEAAEPWAVKALADHLRRDPSNVSKSVKALIAEGFVEGPGPRALTDDGRAQLAAYMRARHGGERRKAKGRWPLDKFRRNPLNRRIDPEKVLGLADTIVGVGDILMPLVASSPDADGVRTIWAGERRWMAAARLAQLGQLPEALIQGLPFNEREADPGEAAVIALVENGARTDLTPWEDALMLRAAADAADLNATELARRIGRARDGDRGGVRDVQQKLKIAREATPEAIAFYEADPGAPGAWEILRASVTDRTTIVTTRPQRLALAELLHKAEGEVGVDVRILPAGHAAEGARLAQYGLATLTRSERGDTARVTQAGLEYLQAEGLSGSIENARHKLGFPEGYGVSAYRTEWLNTPAMEAAPPPDAGAFAGIEPVGDEPPPAWAYVPGQPYHRRFDRHNPTQTVQDLAPNLDYSIEADLHRTTLLDPLSFQSLMLPHPKPDSTARGYPRALIQTARLAGGEGWVYGAGYHTSAWAHHEALHALHPGKEAFPDRETAIAAGVDLITGSLGAATRWKIPADIAAWLAAPRPGGPHVVEGVDYLNASRAAEARRALGLEKSHANHGGGSTRPPARQPDSPPREPVAPMRTPEEGSPASIPESPADHPLTRADDLAEADAARQLAQVQAFVSEDGLAQPFGGWALRKLLSGLGYTGPFVPSGWGGSDDPNEAGVVWDAESRALAVCDANGELPNDAAEAQAGLISYALNFACALGPHGTQGAGTVPWPNAPADETTDQAIIRTGRLLERALGDAATVAGDEALLAEILRQFRQAIQVLERRTEQAEAGAGL